ncbi:hypothetical protein BGZ47_004661 [Haplosporangium gracile]|nr:hypothetical protein BGZ47_004661 [Haplosporangium gracile]
MSMPCYTLRVKLELVDIFHYLQKHITKSLVKDKIQTKSTITYRNFGYNMDIDIAHFTMYDYIRNEETIRKQADQLPLRCQVHDQPEEQSGGGGSFYGEKMTMKAAQVTYTVLVDEYEKSDTRDAVVPSFSASWFNTFKKRYQISYSQLHGEAGGVDLVATEPEFATSVQFAPTTHLTTFLTATKPESTSRDLSQSHTLSLRRQADSSPTGAPECRSFFVSTHQARPWFCQKTRKCLR